MFLPENRGQTPIGPLFRQLTAQGHVVVDVAYRLFPETDVVGMVGDAKRAIAWVRGHAADLGIDPPSALVLGVGLGVSALVLGVGPRDRLRTQEAPQSDRRSG